VIEMIVDGIVDGQKTLHRSGRFEPAHSAFSSARDMKVFHAKFPKRSRI